VSVFDHYVLRAETRSGRLAVVSVPSFSVDARLQPRRAAECYRAPGHHARCVPYFYVLPPRHAAIGVDGAFPRNGGRSSWAVCPGSWVLRQLQRDGVRQTDVGLPAIAPSGLRQKDVRLRVMSLRHVQNDCIRTWAAGVFARRH